MIQIKTHFNSLIPALASAVLVSLLSLAGVTVIVFRENQLKAITFFLISLATGALLGDAIIHLIPEIFQSRSDHLRYSLWILSGILCSFVLEKYLRWKHHEELDHHRDIKPVGRLIILSDG